MKKLLAILLALVMVFALAACGGEQNPTSPTNPSKPSDSGNQNVSGSTIETNLFSVTHSDAWVHVEEDLSNDEDYCYVNLQILDPEDPEYYLIDAEISVSLDDPYDFREDLVYYGFNQYDYKVNEEYETTNIGGAELLRYDDGEETLIYFNRLEGAGASVYVEFDAVDIEDERIEALLEGIRFNIADAGNVDGPWEWEGEAFSTDDHSVSAGSFTLNSTFIPFEDPICTFETFNHSIAAVGDSIYILANGELMQCQYDGSVLAFVSAVELPEDDYELLNSTSDGSLWVSGSMNDILRIENGEIVNTYEDIDNLAMHPSGQWGVNYFVSNECSIVTFNGEDYSTSPITFSEVDTIMNLCVDENYIYACASAADDSGHKVFVYDKSGALQTTLCDAEGESLGSITFVTQTENGFIGFDGNMRDVILWDNSGAFIAECSDGELFGTSYPWFCASTLLDDGSILTILTDEREDRSATEVLVFQVDGF